MKKTMTIQPTINTATTFEFVKKLDQSWQQEEMNKYSNTMKKK
jgi:hypothetical protein